MNPLSSRRFAPILRPGPGGAQSVCLICGTDYYTAELPRYCDKRPVRPGEVACHLATAEDYRRATGRALPP